MLGGAPYPEALGRMAHVCRARASDGAVHRARGSLAAFGIAVALAGCGSEGADGGPGGKPREEARSPSRAVLANIIGHATTAADRFDRQRLGDVASRCGARRSAAGKFDCLEQHFISGSSALRAVGSEIRDAQAGASPRCRRALVNLRLHLAALDRAARHTVEVMVVPEEFALAIEDVRAAYEAISFSGLPERCGASR